MITRFLGLLLILLNSSGCALVEPQGLRKQASTEMACPAEQLQLENIGPDHLAVAGCGERVRYVALCGGPQDCTFVRDDVASTP